MNRIDSLENPTKSMIMLKLKHILALALPADRIAKKGEDAAA
jgi:hypothetical protein